MGGFSLTTFEVIEGLVDEIQMEIDNAESASSLNREELLEIARVAAQLQEAANSALVEND